MVSMLTRIPCARSQAAQCSASVASGVAANWASRAACWSVPIRRRAPGSGFGRKSPLARCWRTYRSTVARPTPSSRATTLFGWPASTAATIRSRISTE